MRWPPPGRRRSSSRARDVSATPCAPPCRTMGPAQLEGRGGPCQGGRPSRGREYCLLLRPGRERSLTKIAEGKIMRKILFLVLIGMVVLAPAIAAAQTGGASGSGTTGAGGSSTTGSGSMSTAFTGSPTSPSASPSSSGTSTGKSLLTITNQADCEAAG